MELINDYKFIIIPIVCAIIAQIIKFLIETIKTKKLNIKRLFNGNGGMPSTHSSFASSLATIIGLEMGFASPVFAITFIFASIVLYDSMGVRLQTEKQAEAINKISRELETENPKFTLKKLKDQIGHEPLEVLMGVILGISLGCYLFSYIGG